MKRSLVPSRPSPALVISILALIVALAGTAYAATKLPKNSVGAKQIKKNAVTTAKLKKGAVTGAKVKKESLTGTNINLAKLGTVPVAQTANSLATPEAIHLVGAAGEPPFLSGSGNVGQLAESGINLVSSGFYKDHDGVVHLEGVAKIGEEGSLPGAVFQLPVGFRPPAGTVQIYTGNEKIGGAQLLVFGSNTSTTGKDVSGLVLGEVSKAAILSGITFRASS